MTENSYETVKQRLVDHIAVDWTDDKPACLPRDENQWFQYVSAVESIMLDEQTEQHLGMDRLSSAERACVVAQAVNVYIDRQ